MIQISMKYPTANMKNVDTDYGTSPKISSTLFHTFFGLNYLTDLLLLFFFLLCGMAKSVEPDQTMPSGTF